MQTDSLLLSTYWHLYARYQRTILEKIDSGEFAGASRKLLLKIGEGLIEKALKINLGSSLNTRSMDCFNSN